MDFHEMSRRAARYERPSAHMPGLMDMIAVVVAGVTLWLGMVFAGPVTEALGWVTP